MSILITYRTKTVIGIHVATIENIIQCILHIYSEVAEEDTCMLELETPLHDNLNSKRYSTTTNYTL